MKILGAASVMSCGGRQSTCRQGDFGTIVTLHVDTIATREARATVTLQRRAGPMERPALEGFTLLFVRDDDRWKFSRVVEQSAS